MAVLAGANEGALNGTTPVTVVAAPGASTQRIVRNVKISNKDTAAVTVTLSKNKAATLRELCEVTLEAGDILLYDDVIVLDATDESVEAVLSGAAATTNPDYDSSYADYS